MKTEASLTLAIVGHLVGDYLLQNDWMALNKKKDSWPCLVHCFLWTVSVMFFAQWGGDLKVPPAVIFIALFIPHFIQDRTQIIMFWMTRINRQPKFVEAPMAPWSIITVDNVWHLIAICAVWKFLI